MRTRLVLAVLMFNMLCSASLFAADDRPPANDKTAHWVGTWASSPQLADERNGPPAPGFADSTLRQIVRVSIGGRRLRVRFSNAFGTTPLTIPSAHVALAMGTGGIQPGSDRTLAFDGQSSVAVPPGALVLSDPLDFDLPALSDLAVTISLRGAPSELTVHSDARATSYISAGNALTATDLPDAARTEHWYFLNGVDVWAKSSAGAIVALGDSITDGAKSTTNGNERWPDALARRLQANKNTAQIAVLNEGIGGNRLVRDISGPNALARFDRDVLAQSGVRWLIVLEGVNDLGTRVSARQRNEPFATAQDLIAAYEQIIFRAHAHNVRVYGATILPYEGVKYFSPDGEEDRQTINKWIRTSSKFDAVIDMDAATRDTKAPSHLSDVADSGDHLHPAGPGYKIMSDTVDLELFRPFDKARAMQ